MPTTAISDISQTREITLPDGRVLSWRDRPLIMGVLNITPDSFSDGGRWLHPQAAVDRAQEMIGQGADMLDLGAESTRPGGGVYGQGAEFVSAEAELQRLLPVLETLRAEVSIPISVDTRKGTVARAAIGAGADLINDIDALEDPELAAVVADAACPVVVMHSRGDLAFMQQGIAFHDVVKEVANELDKLIDQAVGYGIDRCRIVIDPGIGFGKTAEQNLRLLNHLDSLVASGQPVLIGASRKSFIGEITKADTDRRLSGSLATVGWAAHHGAAMVRVHDVAETSQYLAMWQAINSAGRPGN